MLRERSHSQKTTYHRIILIWHVHNKEIYRDRNRLWLPMARAIWDDIKRYRSSIEGDEGVLKLTMMMVAYICEYLKITDLYTLNGWLAWNVNYMSIQLLKTTLWAFCLSDLNWFHYTKSTPINLYQITLPLVFCEKTPLRFFKLLYKKKKSMKHAIKILRMTFV